MRFSDLLRLPYNTGNNIIQIAAILEALSSTPEPVAIQFYSEHGRKDDFQEQYGDIDISRLEWRLTQMSAERICAASRNPAFENWIATVARRTDSFSTDGWKCIDTRAPIVAFWAAHSTWMTPPVFLDRVPAGTATSLRLVEGHTRIAILCGLVNSGAISGDSMHSIWLGSPIDA